MAEPAFRHMTLDEFLSWEDGTDTRYELWGGEVVAMPLAPVSHGRLLAALCAQLGNALRGFAPGVLLSRVAVAPPTRKDTCYIADAVLTSEPLRPHDQLIRHPVLIVEVLSADSTHADWTFKRADYRQMPSVQELVLIDSASTFAQVERRDGGVWTVEIVRERDRVLNLTSVRASISMADLYDGIPLPERPSRAIRGA